MPKSKLKEYLVLVKEVHIQPFSVFAKSAKGALKIVEEGGGEYSEKDLYYSSTLDSDEWEVVEVNNQ